LYISGFIGFEYPLGLHLLTPTERSKAYDFGTLILANLTLILEKTKIWEAAVFGVTDQEKDQDIFEDAVPEPARELASISVLKSGNANLR